ncbi:MAG: murein biosynthesis integral membrane protein MurJ, partial [Smithellaceae bacterium]|nr:murein biosynthesis integral membrane protein MurJ [Smithellaceae bacterium]
FFFGNGDAADAFNAAFRIPNFLQNLFGEGVLSASFIPVYSSLLAKGEEEEARRVAGAVAALLMLTTSIIVVIGVLTAPWLIYAIAPGFSGEKRDLCILLVRILFPGAGLLVWSAWCLGILNSHGKFFLSYTAPVVWNLVIIAVLVIFGGHLEQYPLAAWVAWGSVAGSAMQVIIQLPTVIGLLKRLAFSFDHRISHVRTVIKNFVPVFISRGVVQISAYVDQILASLLTSGAVAGLSYAQTLYTLPVSLFGMSVSAAELPAMSKAVGRDEQVAERLRTRLNDGLRRIAFFVVPSAMAFLALGDVVAAPIYQHGKFTQSDTLYVWGILAGSAVGLLASTLGRLYSSTFYALQDTRTPLRYAIIRVVLAAGLGYLLSQQVPSLIGIDVRWGAVGITAASGFCGWIEFLLLRRSLNRRIGKSGLSSSYTIQLWVAAAAGAAIAWAVKTATGDYNSIIRAVLVLGPYGISYFAACFLMKVPEVRFLTSFMGRIRK